jgi:TRAP-type mannitol/chloroaromatic compound transport system permease small subunit
VPKAIINYVRVVDYLSTKVGRVAMYLIFVMIGVLLLDAITRNVIRIPLHWCIEMAQFTMAAYYIVGGPYSMQLDSHVRMDLLYSRFSPQNRARLDCFTALFLVTYLVVLLIGSISSTIYAIEIDQRKFSMWNPSMIPIKVIMSLGIALMLLQAISMFFKDLAKARGVELS